MAMGINIRMSYSDTNVKQESRQRWQYVLGEFGELVHLVGRGETHDEVINPGFLVLVHGVDALLWRAENAQELFADDLVGDIVVGSHELIAFRQSGVFVVEVHRDV